MNAHTAASQVVSFMLDWAVRAAVLALAAGLVVQVLRVRDVRTRLALWSAVLCGSLVLPAMGPLMPPLLPAAKTVAAPAAVATREVAPVAVTLAPARVFVVRHVGRPVVTAKARAIPVARPSVLPQVAVGVWMAGVLLLLARLSVGLTLARRVIRRAAPIEDQTRHMRGLRVLESGQIGVPMTAGVFRPVVLLPRDWREWESERLRAVLAHERSHVERRDGLMRVVAQLHRAVLWFSPVSWWMQNHLRDLAECASDESAMAETPDRSAYAALVLDFFRIGKKRLAPEGLAMAHGGSASRRIHRILAGGPLGGRVRRMTLVAVITLTAGSVALLAALQQAPPAPAAPHVPAAPMVSGAAPPPPAPAAPRLLMPLGALAIPATPPVPPSPGALDPVDPPDAPEAPETPPPPHAGDDGDGWIMFHGDKQTVDGNTGRMAEAFRIHDRIKQDMIWMRRDGKAWTIDDQELVRKAADLYRQVEDLSGREEVFNQQQEALNREMQRMAGTMDQVRVRMPELQEDLKKLEAKLGEKESTVEELSKLQEKLAEMQNRLAEAESSADGKQEEINRKIDELSQRQDEIGRLQESMGNDIEKAAAVADKAFERMMKDAIRSGLAKPCEAGK